MGRYDMGWVEREKPLRVGLFIRFKGDMGEKKDAWWRITAAYPLNHYLDNAHPVYNPERILGLMTVRLTLHDNLQRTYIYGGITSVKSYGDVLILRDGEFARFGILLRKVAEISLDDEGAWP